MMLMGDSYLIGRRSEKRGVMPEISLDADDAVSHRHALLNRTPDGGLQVRDVGSSNGTRLNGTDLVPLTDMPLKDGDQLIVGHWTRIAVRRLG
jgi:pSer/pThr/pTyr-binding forkhead associated (FHA) protein